MKKQLLTAMAVSFAVFSVHALTAGAAKVEIAMDESAFPYKGHVNYTGIHDSLFVRALVLSDGTTEAAFVVLDEGSVPLPKETLSLVSKASGIAESSIILSATHTHSTLLSNMFGTPDKVLLAYIQHVQDSAVKSITEAKANMKEAEISFIRTESFANVNNGELSNRDNGYDPNGFSDHTLDIMRVTGKNGSPIALLLNYPSHAEVMFKSITKEGGSEISADLPGAVANYLETVSNTAPVVISTAGAEGDQLPLFKSRQETRAFGTVDYGRDGWVLMDILARRVSETVIAALPDMKAIGEQKIAASASSVRIPGQKINLDRKNGKVLSVEKRADVEIPVSVITIGSKNDGLAFEAVGGDVAAKLGSEIRSSSPYKNTVFVTMLAGSVGYILDDESYKKPKHNAAGSPIQPGYAKKAISDGFKMLLKEK